MILDSPVQQTGKGLTGFGLGSWPIELSRTPVGGSLSPSVFPHQHFRRQELLDSLENSPWSRHIGEGQVGVERLRIDLRLHDSAVQECRQLGGKSDGLVPKGHV